GAVDWHVTDSPLAQVNYSHQHYRENGTQADWGSFGGSFPHFDPAILDPTKNYSQKWTFNDNDMDVVGANVTYQVTPDLDVRAAYRFVQIQDENVYSGNHVDFDGSKYTYFLVGVRNAPLRHTNNDGYAFVDYGFDLFGTHHKITAGYYTDSYVLNEHRDSFAF